MKKVRFGRQIRNQDLISVGPAIKSYEPERITLTNGGPGGTQTHGFYLARVALSQLSYKPIRDRFRCKQIDINLTSPHFLLYGIGLVSFSGFRIASIISN